MTLPIIQSLLPRPYPPDIDENSQPFWDALAKGEFLLQCCDACGEWQFPPRPQCPSCLRSELRWQSSDGQGKIYASTRVYAAGGPFACMTPYSVGLIDLDEGVRVLARLLHSASSLPPGSDVQLAVIKHSDGPLFAGIADRPFRSPS